MAAACIIISSACSQLTDVDAPDIVQPDNVDNAAGAEAYMNAAIAYYYGQLGTFVYNSGRLSDEFFIATPFSTFADLDYREQSLTYTEYGPIYMHRARTLAALGIEGLIKHTPENRSAIGRLHAVRGFIETYLGETSCNGTPISEIVDFQPVYGGPITSDSMLAHAVNTFDSALEYASGDPAVLNLARVGKGRALIDRGLWSEAAAAVAAVPTDFLYTAEYTTAVSGQNNYVRYYMDYGYITVSDHEGINGLDFVSANDPRVPTEYFRVGTDGETPIYIFTKYLDRTSPIPIATGIEARLIEAEAALQANPGGLGWLDILNDLRATQIDPALAPLADPGSSDARVDLIFRERAFWMYATGHRAGDLRRLLRQYGRSQDQTWPTGHYKAGKLYGTDVVFILTLSEQANPEGYQCLDKNP
jgi:hypothetical protein